MSRDELVGRIKALEDAIAQSIANHNALLGRVGEAKFMLESMDKQISDDLAKSAND